MGNWFVQLFKKTKPLQLIMIGLDNSGKTTILYKYNLNEVIRSIPTVGFNVETITFKGSTLNVWDIGGQSKIRKLWHHYYESTDGIIFVIDSTDYKRFNGTESVREEIDNILNNDILKGKPILFLFNKCDCLDAQSDVEIIAELNLLHIQDRSIHWLSSSALTGQGLYEGLDWLISQC